MTMSLCFIYSVDMKSNTLPINTSQIHLWFISSPLSTQASVQEDCTVTCLATTTALPGQSTPSSAGSGKTMATHSLAVCRGSLLTFPSTKCAVAVSPGGTARSPCVCPVALRSQVKLPVNQLPNSSMVQPPSESVSGNIPPPHTKSVPVPMSATPPSTWIRPKVLSPNPHATSIATTTTATGLRPVRPLTQPLPPVRTSSCPVKVVPGLKPAAAEGEVYEEVPMHEPDLSRQPSRSVLKSSKSTGGQTFQQQLEKALGLTQRLAAGCHPFPTDSTSSSTSEVIISIGLSRSKSGDCVKPAAAKSLPAVPPKPRLMWVLFSLAATITTTTTTAMMAWWHNHQDIGLTVEWSWV